MRPSGGASLARALVAQLRALLRDVGWVHEIRVVEPGRAEGGEADAVVRVRVDRGAGTEIRVHVESALRPREFEDWARQRGSASSVGRASSLLAMPSVSPRLADLCRAAGWSWLDLSGNCLIDVPGLLRIERTGRASVLRAPRPSANLRSAAAARVLRALLSPAHAGRTWTQRSLRAQTGWKARTVSLGLVNKVVRHLRDEALVEAAGARGVRVRDPKGLLAAWSAAYRFDRHERRGYFTLLKGAALAQALSRLGREAAGMATYAAFSAAERQAPHVRQERTWLYVGAPFLDALGRHAEAKEVDSGENLVVLVPEDAGVFLSFGADSPGDPRALGCTDPVQTYVDLSHCGGRGEEAAQALLEQRILPAWKAAGIP